MEAPHESHSLLLPLVSKNNNHMFGVCFCFWLCSQITRQEYEQCYLLSHLTILHQQSPAMDRLVDLFSACTTSVASTTARCGPRSPYAGVVDDEDAAAATTPIINRANNFDSSSPFCGSLRSAFLDEPQQDEEKNNAKTPRATPEKDHPNNVDSTIHSSSFCGSLHNVFLDEPPEQHENKSTLITPPATTTKLEKDRQVDNGDEEDVMSDVWKDLTLYEDYRPPIPRVIETTTTTSPSRTISPKHKKNVRRNNSKVNHTNNTYKVKSNKTHTSPTKAFLKDDVDHHLQQKQRHHQQHVDDQKLRSRLDSSEILTEDESLMGLDLLGGEEVQKDAELLQRPPTAGLNKNTTSTSELSRQDIVWPGAQSSTIAFATDATDGIGAAAATAATEAKPHVRARAYSSTHSWTYSLTTDDAGGSSRSTGLGGGGGGGGFGGGDEEASPGSSSWSDNDFVDINENDGTTNAIDALFLGVSSSSGDALRATLPAAGGCGAGEIFDDHHDHDGSSYSNRDESSSLLLRTGGGVRSGVISGTNPSTVPAPKITTKTISPRATKRATSTTTTAAPSPFLFHGHEHQPQPLLITASSSPQHHQDHQKLKPQHHVNYKMNSHNSGTLTTRSTSMSDSATLDYSSTLGATHDDYDDTAEDNILVVDSDVPTSNHRLYHRIMEQHGDESLHASAQQVADEADIGEEVETASI
jgi:hypothetical protein